MTVTEIPVDGLYDWAVFGAGSVWVSFQGDDGREKIARIDPATNEVAATIDTGGYPYAASGDAVYAFSFDSGDTPDIVRIDPATNEIVGQLQGPDGFDPNSVAVAGDAVWVANRASSNAVYRFDPATGALVATVEVEAPQLLAATEDAAWVPGYVSGELSRIDAATNTVTGVVDLDAGIVHAEVFDGDVWVANRNEGALTRVDPDTMTVVTTYTIPNADGSGSVDVVGFAVLPGSIWVMGLDDEMLYRVDPASGAVIGTVFLGFGVQVMPVGDGSFWIRDHENDVVLRITPNE